VGGADYVAGVVEEAVLDPVHRQRDVAAAVHPCVQRAVDVDDERLDRLATDRQQELARRPRREVADPADENFGRRVGSLRRRRGRLLHESDVRTMRSSPGQ